MRELQLTNTGRVALVDDEDYRRVALRRWYLHKSGRVVCTAKLTRESTCYRAGFYQSETLYLHREVMGLECGDSGIVVHLDGDLLDNRRQNLQVTTRAAIAQSCQRRRKRANATSRYTGVSQYRGGWTVRITANGNAHYVGRFPLDQEELAARAYDEAARVLHGECATLNFPHASERETAAVRRRFHERVKTPTRLRPQFPPVWEIIG